MKIKTHDINGRKIAEVISEGIVIANIEDGVNLMADCYYQGFDKIIIYEKNITPDFFDLQNKMAGEILQKFSNYRLQLTIVGDFAKCTKKSIREFIYESNKGRLVNFVASLSKALE